MSASLSARGLKVSSLTVWVLVTFIGAQLLAQLLLIGLAALFPAIASMNTAVQVSVFAALSYVIGVSLVLGAPYLVVRSKTSLETLGISRSVSWSDIGLSILSMLPYYIASGVLVWVLSRVLPDLVDMNQVQAIPFQNLTFRYEYAVAFITLVVLAPLAEELFFRGYFLGKLKTNLNVWASVIITALVFGLLHLPGNTTASGIELQWAVAIDTFALGVVLGVLRVTTGSIWAGVLLHMVKNTIGFFFLFIYPTLAGTM